MASIAIMCVLLSSTIGFLFGILVRVTLRNEADPRYKTFGDNVIKASLVFPVIYGVLVLVIGLAPIS